MSPKHRNGPATPTPQINPFTVLLPRGPETVCEVGVLFFQGVGARVRSRDEGGEEVMQISTQFTVHKTHGERGRLNHREGGGGRRAGAAGKHLQQQRRKQTRVTATTKEKS